MQAPSSSISSSRISPPQIRATPPQIAKKEEDLIACNPVLRIEDTVLQKLVAIGMLSSDGILSEEAIRILAKVPKEFINLESIKDLARNKVVSIDSGIAKTRVDQKRFHKLIQGALEVLKIPTGETYLCGSHAEELCGVMAHFTKLVQIYLETTGRPKHCLDQDLRTLSAKIRINDFSQMEWLDVCEYDLNRIDTQRLKESILEQFNDLSKYITEHSFLDVVAKEECIEVTFGNSKSTTTRKIGIFMPLFTQSAFRIPVKFYLDHLNVKAAIHPIIEPSCCGLEYNQCVVDSALGILRFAREPSEAENWAQIPQRITSNLPVSPIAPIEASEKHVKALFSSPVSHPVAMALAASPFVTNPSAVWEQVPKTSDPFFDQIRQLIQEAHIPFPMIHSLLGLAAWVRLCHSSESEDITVQFKFDGKSHFVISKNGNTVFIPITTKRYAEELLRAKEDQIAELKKLWDIILPKRISSMTKTAHFENLRKDFKLVADTFLLSDSLHLKHLGYVLAIASRDENALGRELENVFRNLLRLVPPDLEQYKSEIQFLVSFLTPNALFKTDATSTKDLTQHFILHLLNNGQVTYGHFLLESLINQLQSDRTSLFLMELLQKQISVNADEAFRIYKKFNKKIIPHIAIREEYQKTIAALILKNASLGHYQNDLLAQMAKTHNDELWEKTVLSFCNMLQKDPTKGTMAALLAWDNFDKLKSVPFPVQIFYDLAPNQALPFFFTLAERKQPGILSFVSAFSASNVSLTEPQQDQLAALIGESAAKKQYVEAQSALVKVAAKMNEKLWQTSVSSLCASLKSDPAKGAASALGVWRCLKENRPTPLPDQLLTIDDFFKIATTESHNDLLAIAKVLLSETKSLPSEQLHILANLILKATSQEARTQGQELLIQLASSFTEKNWTATVTTFCETMHEDYRTIWATWKSFNKAKALPVPDGLWKNLPKNEALEIFFEMARKKQRNLLPIANALLTKNTKLSKEQQRLVFEVIEANSEQEQCLEFTLKIAHQLSQEIWEQTVHALCKEPSTLQTWTALNEVRQAPVSALPSASEPTSFCEIAKQHPPQLLAIATKMLSPEKELTREEQLTATRAIEEEAKMGVYEEGRTLLIQIANQLDSDIFEKTVLSFCSAMLHDAAKSPQEGIRTWETLSKVRAASTQVFDTLKSNQIIDISEDTLAKLDPLQQIAVIKRGWCKNVEASKRRQILTSALLSIDENQITSILKEYRFTDEECDLNQVQTLLLTYFDSALPAGQEILRLQFLLNTTHLPILANHYQNSLSKLFSKIDNLPASQSKEKVCLDVIERMAEKVTGDASLAVLVIDRLTSWQSVSEFFHQNASKIIKKYDSVIFAALIEGNRTKEALEFLKMIELQKFPTSSNSFKSKQIYSLLCHNLSTLPFARVKFALKQWLNSDQGIKLLLKILPLLQMPERKECKDMLFARLRKSEKVSRYYSSTMRTFGKEGSEVFIFFLQLPGCNKTELLQNAKDSLFLAIPKEELVRLLREHFVKPPIEDVPKKVDAARLEALLKTPSKKLRRQSRQQKTKVSGAEVSSSSVELLIVLEAGLKECVNASFDLKTVLSLMSDAKFWPQTVLQQIKANYLAGEVFTELRRLPRAGNVGKEYFAQLFKTIVSNPSEDLLQFTTCYSELEELFPEAEKEKLRVAYIIAVIPFLKKLPDLCGISSVRENLLIPHPFSLQLVQKYLDSRDAFLIYQAYTVTSLHLQHLNSEEKNEWMPIVEKMAFEDSLTKRFLGFLKVLYNAYPNTFEERAKRFIEAKLIAECKGGFFEEGMPHEQKVIQIFYYIAESATPENILLCEHYLTHFCQNFSQDHKEMSALLFAHSRLCISDQTEDIVQAINCFIPCYKQKKEHEYAKLLESTIHEVLTALTKLASRDFSLFFKKFGKVFTILGREGDSSAYHFDLLSMLLEESPTPELVEFAAKQLESVQREDKKKFQDIFEELIFFTLRMESFPRYSITTYQDLCSQLKRYISSLKKEQLFLLSILGALVTRSVDEYLLTSISATCTRLLKSRSLSKLFHLLLRVQPLLEEHPAHSGLYWKQFFDVLATVNFSSTIDILLSSCKELTENSPGYLSFTNALKIILSNKLKRGTSTDFQEARELIHSLHLDYGLARVPLLDCYELLFVYLGSLLFDRGFPIAQELSKDFIAKLDRHGKIATEEDATTMDLIFMKFFNTVILTKNFPERETDYFELGVNLLHQLHQRDVFHNKYSLFSCYLKLLVPLIVKQDNPCPRLYHILGLIVPSELLDKQTTSDECLFKSIFEKIERSKVVNATLVKALISFINSYISANQNASNILAITVFFLKDLYIHGSFKHNLPLYHELVNLFMPCIAHTLQKKEEKQRFGLFYFALKLIEPHKTVDVLEDGPTEVTLFEDFLAKITNGDPLHENTLTTLFNFMHSYIPLLPVDIAKGIINHLVSAFTTLEEKRYFTNNSSLRYCLLHQLIPHNQFLILNSDGNSDQLLPFVCLESSAEVVSVETVNNLLKFVCAYTKSLSLIETSACRALRITALLKAAKFLQNLLIRKTFKENTVSHYLRFISQLIPESVSLIHAQADAGEKSIDIFSNMLFDKLEPTQEQPLDAAFLIHANLKASMRIITSYISSLLAKPTPMSLNFGTIFLKRISKILQDFAHHKVFEKSPGTYYEMIDLLVPCQMEIFKQNIAFGMDTEDVLFGALLQEFLQKHPSFCTVSSLETKMKSLSKLFTATYKMMIGMEKIPANLINYKINQLKKVLAFLSSRRLPGANLLTLIEYFVPASIELNDLELRCNRDPSDFIIYSVLSDSCKKLCNTKQLIDQRSKIVKSYAIELGKLPYEKARQWSAILLKAIKENFT